MLTDRPITPRVPRSRGAAASSVVVQAVFAILLVLIGQRLHVVTSGEQPTSDERLVFLASAGPGGGGGGGGDQKPLPSRPAVTPPPPKPAPAPTPIPKPAQPEPVPTIDVPSIVTPPALLGAIDSTAPTLDTRGLGDGPGTNGGKGGGADKGDGDGLGAGKDKGTGGGWYKPGNGVSTPKLLNAVRPNYTADAMRARISGSVWLECVVEPNGTVDRCRLSRSLDPNLGLDQEALKAAQKWTFEPGKKSGEAVPVQVTIELAFSLR